jgi:adenylate cyclase
MAAYVEALAQIKPRRAESLHAGVETQFAGSRDRGRRTSASRIVAIIRAVPREIERKFLLKSDAWRAAATRVQRMTQGYVAGGARASVRVRVAGDYAAINIKSGGLVASRLEYEYPIPVDQARELLELCVPPLIDKTRHFVPFGGFEWEIDEFHGDNAGLIVAELELDHEDQEFPRPDWVGTEVTQIERYYNVRLVQHPYREWSERERNA